MQSLIATQFLSFKIGNMKLIDSYSFCYVNRFAKPVKIVYDKEARFKNFHNIKSIMGNIWTSYVEMASVLTKG